MSEFIVGWHQPKFGQRYVGFRILSSAVSFINCLIDDGYTGLSFETVV